MEGTLLVSMDMILCIVYGQAAANQSITVWYFLVQLFVSEKS